MTDQEIKKKISELESLNLGEKGYVMLWREPGALGAIAFPCHEARVGPFGFMTLSMWSVNRVVVSIGDDEDEAIDSLINWFDSSSAVHAPGISCQGRFSGWTVDKIIEHHHRLLEEKTSWNNNRLGSDFIFKFMDDFQREKWSKRILDSHGEHEGLTSNFEGDTLVVSYRWPGNNV